jgi:hypothetical protein
MNKNQWANCVNFMKLKWPNFHWTDEQAISAFDELKGFDIRHIEGAIERSFKAGDEFVPNPSKIYASASEIMRYEYTDHEVPQFEGKKYSLNDYLKEIGCESFAHAMYESGKKRQLQGTKAKYETIDYSKEWFDGGKESYAKQCAEEGGIGFSSGLFKVKNKLGEE